MFGMLFRAAQDPQIDIVMSKNRDKINSINNKLKKQKAWKRNAKDTNQVSALQTQNWGLQQLKALAKSEAKLRIYIDYGETQVNVLETQPLTEEQKAARLEKKKPVQSEEVAAPVKPKEGNELKF